MVGIYGIKNKKTNKIYVGQSKNIQKRWKTHMTELKNEKHRNKHLLNSFKIHGEDCFEFLVLEECEELELDAKEEEWINKFPKELVYNQNMHIVDLRGKNNPFYGKTHNENSKKKMSIWKRENFKGDKNPNFGKKWPFEKRVKNAFKHPGTKLSKKDVLKIKDMIIEGKLEDKEIASIFNVGRTVVTRICNGTRWGNITGGKIKSERRGQRNIGKKFSDETKDKIRKAITGIKRSEETKKKISMSKRRVK
jgi:group I intron endonuclease